MADVASVGKPNSRTTEDVHPARVFVGLKLALEIARQLAELARPLEHYDIRLVPSADMHLTLVPPWNEPAIDEAAARLRMTINRFNDFSLTFTRLLYGPTLHHPHLLWAECAISDALIELRMALLTAFGQSDPRPFRPHVTLARISKGGRAIALKIPLGRNLSLTQHVTSVQLFQSPPERQSGYRVLASLSLGAEPRHELTLLP